MHVGFGTHFSRKSLGRWLYGVAHRVALRARSDAEQRPSGFEGVAPPSSRAGKGTKDDFVESGGLCVDTSSHLPRSRINSFRGVLSMLAKLRVRRRLIDRKSFSLDITGRSHRSPAFGGHPAMSWQSRRG